MESVPSLTKCVLCSALCGKASGKHLPSGAASGPRISQIRESSEVEVKWFGARALGDGEVYRKIPIRRNLTT